LAYESEYNFSRRGFEMEEALKVEIECLGKVLEGEGKIKSILEEKDYEAFGSALRESIVAVEEADCAACIDGRCVDCLHNGEPAKIRPRKAGGSLSTFVMMGIGDKNFLDGLEDNAQNAEDLFAASSELQTFLGNKESGHVDCGAAAGAISHVRGVSQLKNGNRNLEFAKDVVAAEFPNQDTESMSDNIRNQAAEFAYVLDSRRWNGEQYVENIAHQDPECVEVLHQKDDEVHGHAEDAIVIIDGLVDGDLRPLHTIYKDKLKELTGHEAFIVNLNELRRDAFKLGSTEKQKAQLYLSTLVHHAGGAYPKLGDGSQPVFIVRIAQ
jgi:hypothetical protein